jgi:hypothetical protein
MHTMRAADRVAVLLVVSISAIARRVREAVTTGVGDDQVETRVLERPCLHVSLGQSIQ